MDRVPTEEVPVNQAMPSEPEDRVELQRRAEEEGLEALLTDLFTRHVPRLRRMVCLRLDRRLQGRIDESDVLQEAWVEALDSFEAYVRESTTPFFPWIRCITARKLLDLHRHHLGAQARDARREVHLYRSGGPEASSEALAARLLGNFTSPPRWSRVTRDGASSRTHSNGWRRWTGRCSPCATSSS